MKIFEKNGKINFVDKNNVFVGFDYMECCCENFGYLIVKDKTTAENVHLEIDLDRLNQRCSIELEEFCFDKKYFKEISGGNTDNDDNQNYAIFRLINPPQEIYLIIYNHHNGYYGHGFEFFDDKFKLKTGCL